MGQEAQNGRLCLIRLFTSMADETAPVVPRRLVPLSIAVMGLCDQKRKARKLTSGTDKKRGNAQTACTWLGNRPISASRPV